MPSDDRLKFSRRDFILSLLSVLTASVTLQGCGEPRIDNGQILHRLSQTIGDQAAAGRFGQAYLKEHPSEADIGLLLECIGGDIDRYTPELMADHLDHQIRNEYRRGESVRVDGWVLSRTEARLYAIMALL